MNENEVKFRKASIDDFSALAPLYCALDAVQIGAVAENITARKLYLKAGFRESNVRYHLDMKY